MVISRYRRGEWHSPSHDTGKFPCFRNNDFRYSFLGRISKQFKWIFFGNGEWNKKMMNG